MKKIVLIEDRYKRQQSFLEHNNIDIDKYSDILENFIEEKASNLLENITNNSFDLKEFDYIICHKSVQYDNTNTQIIGILRDYCKKYNKTLVLFSGGISVNYYDNSEFELLELNSKTFYSQNLVFFLETIKTKNEDIMMLCYGEHWKQNIVANVLEKTNRLITKIEEKANYIKIVNFIGIEKLSKIDYEFYKLEIDNNQTTKNEIEKLRDSLSGYFNQSKISSKKTKTLKIHSNNVIDIEFDDEILFQSSDEIDTYISCIIKELVSKECDTIFIKDNLSSNYLELYGLRVAYHIRLSSELGNRRFVPIVIISDFEEATLNGFTKEANILFTEGTYICKNTKEEIEKYQSLELQGVTNYDEFLNDIEVTPPKDTSGSHDIANKWSIYRWAEFLGTKSEAIDENKNEVENELYFKYLKALNETQENEPIKIIEPTKKGKVLLIDDEWNKGWADILKTALAKDGLEYGTFEYDFKDKTQFNLYMQIQKKIKEFDPDVVLLDLRLAQSDYENDDFESYTGAKILQKIHEINAGIQVIMLTATSKSTILEKLYQKKILGYIKKEHPEDKSIDTVENINKLVELVDSGLKRKYLKSIFLTRSNILSILENDIFAQYGLDIENYEPYWIKLQVETKSIFDILDGNSENKYLYAMVSIASSLETILTIFVRDRHNEQNLFWDGTICNADSLNGKLRALFHQKFEYPENNNEGYPHNKINMNTLIQRRNDYLHTRQVITITSEQITSWFNKLRRMIEIVNH